MRTPAEIEYILTETNIEGYGIIAIYDLKSKKEKSAKINIDFFMNTITVEDRNTIVLSKPIAILCDNLSYFLEDEKIKLPKIIEQSRSEELQKKLSFYNDSFGFLVLHLANIFQKKT